MDQIAKLKDQQQRAYDKAVQSVAGRKSLHADPNAAAFAQVVRKHRAHIKVNFTPSPQN